MPKLFYFIQNSDFIIFVLFNTYCLWWNESWF